jgi:VCBS repeat-containing protein
VAASGAVAGLPDTATLIAWLNLGAVAEAAAAAPGTVGWNFAAADASFDYLAAGETATLVYTVQITDNSGATVTQAVTVTVTGTNDAPVTSVPGAQVARTATATALNGVLITDADGSASQTVTLSDTKGNLAASATSGATITGSGTKTLTISGTLAAVNAALNTLTYTSATGGTDTVTVVTSDGSTSNTQTIAETINTTVDHAPVLASGSVVTGTASELPGLTASTTRDTATGAILFTDADTTDTHVLSVTAVSAAGATAGLPASATMLGWLTRGVVTEPAGGTPGSAAWNFSAADKSLDYLATGQVVTLTYTVKLADNHGGAVNQTVTLTVTGSNDGPTIASGSVATGRITELASVTGSGAMDGVSGVVKFADADLADVHTAQVTGVVASGVTTGLPASATVLSWLNLGALTEPAGTTPGAAIWNFSAIDSAFDYLTAGQVLTLTYTLQLSDNHGGTVSPNVAITVIGSNDAPAFVASGSTINGALTEQAGLTSSALTDTASGVIAFADVDNVDTHSLRVASVIASGATTGLAANATVLSWLKAGAIAEQAGGAPGSAAWTFSAADRSFDYLAAGQVLTLTYVLTLLDNHGGTVNQNAVMTITGTNDAPTIASGTIATGAIVELAGATASTMSDTVSGTIRFADADVVDVHAASLTSVVASGVGTGLPDTATLMSWLKLGSLAEAAGTTPGSVGWTFSAADGAFDYLAAGQLLTLTYVVLLDDAHGGTVGQNIVVKVTGANDAPIFAAASSTLAGAVTEQAGLTASATADTAGGVLGFADADLTDTHILRIASVAVSGVTSGLPANATMLAWLKAGTITEPAAGAPGAAAWSFSAADRSFDYLAAGEVLTLAYVLTLADNHGGSFSQTATITVTGTDDAPVVASGTSASATVATRTATAGLTTSDTAAGTIRFTDADLTDTHAANVTSVSATGTTIGLPDAATMLSWLNLGALAEPAGTTTGSLAWNFAAVDSAFDYLPAGQSVTLAYTVQVADNHGGSLPQVVTVKVNGVNYKPTTVDHSGFTTDNWTPLTIDAWTLLSGARDTNMGDILSLSAVGGAVGGKVALVNGDAVFTPTATLIGPASFTYTVSDGHGGTATSTVNLTTSLHTIVAAAGASVTGTAMPGLIDGSAGSATLQAGSAGDTLVGGPGDTLIGGAGIDTFAFHTGFGQNTVTNFTATGTKHDLVQVDTSIFADWAHLLGATRQVGSDLQITLDPNDTITLKSVALANFTSADAHFV